MKSYELVTAFFDYYTSLDNPMPMGDDGKGAVLYGTDQFRLDTRKGRIKLLKIGWISLPGIIGQDFTGASWASCTPDGSNWTISIGPGNPYEAPQSDNFLVVGSVIRALPISLVDLAHQYSVDEMLAMHAASKPAPAPKLFLRNPF
jgi:hypothetical protein